MNLTHNRPVDWQCGAIEPRAMVKRSAAMPAETLVSTTWYYYNYAGNVRHVVTEKETGQPKFEATRLKYAQNGRAVTYVLGETWNKSGGQIVDYDITYAREFRYDAARQRYMNRALDPDALEGGSRVPLSTVWSDFDGDEIYGDFEIDGQTITELRSFELGLAKVDPWTTVGGADTSYYHTDMIGTTRFMTDSIGDDMDSAVYTAFGERISGTQHRYGYAGAWSYQAHDDVPFLHVGARYYDPASGRFLQRDPIGIAGGANVYVYVDGSPTIWVDPSGEMSWLGGLNKGKLRVGPSRVRIGYRRWITRFALRYKNLHIYGLRAVGATGGLVGASAVLGGATGYGISCIKVKKKRISDHIGDLLGKLCPGCWDW